MVLNALHANHAVLGEDEADENAGTGSSPHRSKARTPATAEEEEEEEEEEDDDVEEAEQDEEAEDDEHKDETRLTS